jgi:hypothetical protein
MEKVPGMNQSRRAQLDNSCAQYLADLKKHRALFDAWRRASGVLVRARASGDHKLIATCRAALDDCKDQLREWEREHNWNPDRHIGSEKTGNLTVLATPKPEG